MNKLLPIALLILVTNLWGLSAAQAETTLGNLVPIAKTEETSLKLLGIGSSSNYERAQFIADIEVYTTADFTLERMTNPEFNKEIKNMGQALNRMRPSLAQLMPFSMKVTFFNMPTGSMGEFRKTHPELRDFFTEVNQAIWRGQKAGKEAGDNEINAITSDINFISRLNDYAAILEQFEKGKFGEIIRAAEKQVDY